jgi:hypothetical protein
MGNRSLLKGVGLAALVTVAAAELGLLNRLLGTTRLDLEQRIICFVVSLAVLALVEVAKLLGVSARAVESDGAGNPGAASAGIA